MNERSGGRVVHWRDMHDRAAAILRELEVDIDPRTLASQLTVGAQQAVEIAKAMSRSARILIMDEPTAALSAHEVDRLFRQVRPARRIWRGRCCSSVTGSTRCFSSVTASPCSATVSTSRRSPSQRSPRSH